MMSKVQCVFWFENYTTEGRGGEKGGSANFKTKHIEPMTSQIIPSLYIAYERDTVICRYGNLSALVLLQRKILLCTIYQ